MTAAVTELLPICAQLAEGSGEAGEVDWSKVKGMEFREALNERSARLRELEALPIKMDSEFEETVRRACTPKLTRQSSPRCMPRASCGLRSTRASELIRSPLTCSLRLAISEQNLELLPEYEQRVQVLQDLDFIDANSTVLLKGRAACEVRRRDY